KPRRSETRRRPLLGWVVGPLPLPMVQPLVYLQVQGQQLYRLMPMPTGFPSRLLLGEVGARQRASPRLLRVSWMLVIARTQTPPSQGLTPTAGGRISLLEQGHSQANGS